MFSKTLSSLNFLLLMIELFILYAHQIYIAGCIILGHKVTLHYFPHSVVSWDHERVKSPPKSSSLSYLLSRSICSLLDYVGTSQGRTLSRLIAVEAQLWKSNPQLELPGHKITLYSWHRDHLKFFSVLLFLLQTKKIFQFISLSYFQLRI